MRWLPRSRVAIRWRGHRRVAEGTADRRQRAVRIRHWNLLVTAHRLAVQARQRAVDELALNVEDFLRGGGAAGWSESRRFD
jgi:hypothetical protein